MIKIIKLSYNFINIKISRPLQYIYYIDAPVEIFHLESIQYT